MRIRVQRLLFALAFIALSPGFAWAVEDSVWQGVGALKSSTRGYVETPMGQVHYLMQGEGVPVLLLHQTPWFSVQFARVLPHLADRGIQAIAPDRPGYGLSDPPDEPKTMDAYADNLVHVLDALGLERVAVVGHNTGASVAVEFARRHPDRVTKLVLHGTPLYTKEEQAVRLARPHWDRWLEADGSHLKDYFAGRGRIVPSDAPLQGLQWSVLAFFLAGETEWYGHQAAFSYDMEAAIKELTVPTFLFAHEGDALASQTKRASDLRPDFDYKEYARAYSHIMYDDPKPWADKVADYILGD